MEITARDVPYKGELQLPRSGRQGEAWGAILLMKFRNAIRPSASTVQEPVRPSGRRGGR